MPATSPNQPTRTAKPGAKHVASSTKWLAATLLLALTGCNTPGTRAQEKRAAFTQLPPTDQRLVLRGAVQPGLTREAVFIAWGTPTLVIPASQSQGPLDAWVYTRTFYGTGGGYYGVPRGLVYSRERRRYLYDGNDYYETPVYIRAFGQVSTAVPYRRALFDHNGLVRFESLRADPAPTPGGNRDR